MKIYKISLKGIRKTNEDEETTIVNINKEDETKGERNMFAIYDGHGSTNGKIISSFLSKIMPHHLMNKDLEVPLKKAYVKKLYTSIQTIIKTKLTKYADHNGSTCLIVLQYKHNNSTYLDILNTGDSRCIICKENKNITKFINLTHTKQQSTFTGTALTKDHKPNWTDEIERITALGGKSEIKFDGVDWRIGDLSVSRSFGDVDSEKYVTYMPDLYRYKIEREDRFIVLACDGLWDVMTTDEVCNFIVNYSYDVTTGKKNNTKDNIAKKLGEYAINVKKSTDNVSIIIVFFDE